jgi:BirA family transcriptional regulator, biotin operon repressor / biotin---[acetyl-CoA-carboxylase] ligase
MIHNSVPFKRIHLPQTHSTNKLAAEMHAQGEAIVQTILSTDFQTEGKGQESNAWHSEAGKNLLFSMVIHPKKLHPARQFMLTKAVSLGICDALAVLVPYENIRIKWPNDIYVDDKKMGGILISNTISGQDITLSIIGIGLNVNQTAFPEWIPNPVSLKQLMGMHADREALLAELENTISARLELLNYQAGENKLDADYLEKLYQLHDWKFYRVKGEEILGSITGVDEFGHLLLDTNDGSQLSCDLKEVVFL